MGELGELVVCGMDLHPVNPGHLIVIPKRHAAGLHELDEDTGAHMFRVALRMQRALRASELPCDGINTLLADGESAWQDVFHVHLQVIPRLPDDRLRITVELAKPGRAELDRAAGAIRAACRGPAATPPAARRACPTGRAPRAHGIPRPDRRR